MDFLLAVVVIILIMVVTRWLHGLLLRMFCEAVAPAPVLAQDRIVQQAVADLDREYEDLVRHYR